MGKLDCHRPGAGVGTRSRHYVCGLNRLDSLDYIRGQASRQAAGGCAQVSRLPLSWKKTHGASSQWVTWNNEGWDWGLLGAPGEGTDSQ